MILCPLCHSVKGWPLQWNDDASIRKWRADDGDSRDYTWTLCGQCGNGYPSFQPELDLLSYYWNRDRQDTVAALDEVDAVWNSRRAVARKAASRSFRFFRMVHRGPQGRFLDIACGLGEAVKYFADRGWDAYGVDADPAVKRFHDLLGIRTEIGQIETVEIAGKFDIIHIAHAIYFITGPRQFLESLRDRLNDGGLLCIVLANFLACEDHSLPGYPHSFFPTASSMRYLLALAGYDSVLCRKKSGSVYIAAQCESGGLPGVYPRIIRMGFQTKKLRYAVAGRSKVLLHSIAKRFLQLIRAG